MSLNQQILNERKKWSTERCESLVTDIFLETGQLTTTQKNALTAVNGMVVYDTTLSQFQFYQKSNMVLLLNKM
jgi:hypothetical protein